MADNTRLNPGEFGDLVATDELSTLNGGAAPAGLKVQRVKIGYGADGDFNDATTLTPIPVQQASGYTETSGTLAAVSQTVIVTGLTNANGVLVTTSGTFSGTIIFEASNNGTNWYTVMMTRASSGVSESSRALTGTTLEAWRGSSVGWSQFRVRCSAYTSGTASITVFPSAVPIDPSIGASQVGTWIVNNRSNIYYNDTTTNLGASDTFTGTARDIAIAAGSASPYVYFNAIALANQAGTLRIEMSNNNSTWFRATVDTAVAADTPVTLSARVVTRYYRVVYVNGGVAQTSFVLNSGYSCS
jgi:hypothetical protein